MASKQDNLDLMPFGSELFNSVPLRTSAVLPQPSYNVSGPGSYSDDELAAMIRSLVPAADIEFEGRKVDDGSFSGGPLDYSAAHRDFGYTPEYTLETGLSAFLAELHSRK